MGRQWDRYAATMTALPTSTGSRPEGVGRAGEDQSAAAARSPGVTAGNRRDRVGNRVRNPKWKSPALYIDMSICINCDTCLRHCPPQFGAIFNHGLDVIIVSELCSGCGKCLPPVCPVDCIFPVVPSTEPTPEAWWEHPYGPEDPYV